jgi:hypothetical protein
MYQAYFYNPNISTGGAALALLSEKGTGTNTHIMALSSITNIGSGNYLYGSKSAAYSTTALSTGRTYGVYGLAGNASQGFNYGVYGYLYGTRYGAAVFGTTSAYGDLALTQQYAGYFRGDAKVEGILYANVTPLSSDLKFKDNIVTLDAQNSLDNILAITPISYKLKQVEVTSSSGDSTNVHNYFDEKAQYFSKTRYGVIAQDLQKIFPDMVYQDGDGNLAVAYTELIAILINAVQAEERKIKDLEERIIKLESGKADQVSP